MTTFHALEVDAQNKSLLRFEWDGDALGVYQIPDKHHEPRELILLGWLDREDAVELAGLIAGRMKR